MPVDSSAESILPHGHNLLREMTLTATLPDGRVLRMLRINDWDINWQGQYHLREPVRLPAGTKLEAVAVYDNSSANPRNPFDPAAARPLRAEQRGRDARVPRLRRRRHARGDAVYRKWMEDGR